MPETQDDLQQVHVITLKITVPLEYGGDYTPPNEWNWSGLICTDPYEKVEVLYYSMHEGPVAERRTHDEDEVSETRRHERVKSASAWSYMPSQQNGDGVSCQGCGNLLNDDLPIVNDSKGYAFHEGCQDQVPDCGNPGPECVEHEGRCD